MKLNKQHKKILKKLKITTILISRGVITIFFLYLIYRTAMQLLTMIPFWVDVLKEGVKNLTPEMKLIAVTISLMFNAWILNVFFQMYITVDKWLSDLK